MKILMILVLCLFSALTQAKETIPQDVQAFIHNAEDCKHFAGEFDGGLNKARQREIERSVVKYCKRAQSQLKTLSVRYKDDAKISEIIRSNTNDSVISFR
ncbi:hypothetical protein GTP46_12985 [Duganella sp. FT135W]|uniref:Uncharacterized protein n=1 Tax=Duganella flavida TaxID=2692175 RepID=A0A6L8KCJ9_9BURK|nr:hypothetical protein [Duganella flavida]MYM23562.1 hypothetical protein [Duganella flavida]